MDALAKVILSTLPDTDEDARTATVARGKLRYSRFIKSVGANMVGDADAALSELADRVPERDWLAYNRPRPPSPVAKLPSLFPAVLEFGPNAGIVYSTHM
jgi:hypothetical protein